MSPTPLPRTVWHASRAVIDRPTIAGRTEGDNHENSGLGLYCATEPADYIAGFGQTVHELTLKEDVRTMRLGISELAAMSQVRGELPRSRAWFEAEGRRWGQDYDIVELVETNGRVDQVILLNESAIATCRAHRLEDFLARRATPRSRLGP